MHIAILGSGGFRAIPKPLCHCSLCVRARTTGKGVRRGPCFYIQELDLLIETPLEIREQLQYLGHFPTRVTYSHWHPDHTEGYRVFELFPCQPQLYLPERSHLTARIPALSYLESTGRIRLVDWKKGRTIKSGNCKATFIKLTAQIPAFAFLIKERTRKVLVCPDHGKFLLQCPPMLDLDLLIMNLGTFALHDRTLTRFEDTLEIIRRFRPKRTLLTHIDEHFQITEKRQKELERRYRELHLSFTHDFQEVIIER